VYQLIKQCHATLQQRLSSSFVRRRQLEIDGSVRADVLVGLRIDVQRLNALVDDVVGALCQRIAHRVPLVSQLQQLPAVRFEVCTHKRSLFRVVDESSSFHLASFSWTTTQMSSKTHDEKSEAKSIHK
jgi:hypothetical protein